MNHTQKNLSETRTQKKANLAGWLERALKETHQNTNKNLEGGSLTAGHCYNLKISPTVSLESQSSRHGKNAKGANLTFCRGVYETGKQFRRLLDWPRAKNTTLLITPFYFNQIGDAHPHSHHGFLCLGSAP